MYAQREKGHIHYLLQISITASKAAALEHKQLTFLSASIDPFRPFRTAWISWARPEPICGEGSMQGNTYIHVSVYIYTYIYI